MLYKYRQIIYTFHTYKINMYKYKLHIIIDVNRIAKTKLWEQGNPQAQKGF